MGPGETIPKCRQALKRFRSQVVSPIDYVVPRSKHRSRVSLALSAYPGISLSVIWNICIRAIWDVCIRVRGTGDCAILDGRYRSIRRIADRLRPFPHVTLSFMSDGDLRSHHDATVAVTSDQTDRRLRSREWN